MIAKIAWRNIWRHRLRSLVLIAAIALGLWAGIFISAVTFGLSQERKAHMIRSQLSHLQIHHPEFPEFREADYFIENGPEILEKLEKHPNVLHATARTQVQAMASSARGASGVLLQGIIPEREREVTGISENIPVGNYFEDDVRNPVLVGEALANKLKLQLRSQMVLTFQDLEGEIVAASFRVVGIYRAPASGLEDVMIYARIEDVNKYLSEENIYHEFAVIVGDDELAAPVARELQEQLPNLLVRHWRQLSPELGYMDQMMDYFLYFFVGIVLLALSFGMINTMLMAILERVRELGMLMSIGMNKMKVFAMILLETIFVAFAGASIGFLLSFVSIKLAGRNGLDLGFLAGGFEEFGFSAVVYPEISFTYYLIIGGMVIVFAVLSAVYPAFKGLRLNPAEAIRKI